MNSETDWRNRRAPGTRTAAHFSVRVTWVSTDDESVQEASGRMINVSPAGALLALNLAPNAGGEVFLHVAPTGEQAVEEDNQISFAAWTLWTSRISDDEFKAAFELDFSGEWGQEYMRRWMELIYEPLALSDALEGKTTAQGDH